MSKNSQHVPSRTRVCDALKGLTIVDFRPLTTKERNVQWCKETIPPLANPHVLILSDGSRSVASLDCEGNGPGVMVLLDAKGRALALDGK